MHENMHVQIKRKYQHPHKTPPRSRRRRSRFLGRLILGVHIHIFYSCCWSERRASADCCCCPSSTSTRARALANSLRTSANSLRASANSVVSLATGSTSTELTAPVERLLDLGLAKNACVPYCKLSKFEIAS